IANCERQQQDGEHDRRHDTPADRLEPWARTRLLRTLRLPCRLTAAHGITKHQDTRRRRAANAPSKPCSCGSTCSCPSVPSGTCSFVGGAGSNIGCVSRNHSICCSFSSASSEHVA